MKKLSVIIPVYNVAQYVEKCLRSVLDNDLAQQDIEIIVVDDQSPDHSVEIVRDIARDHPNITVISQKNKGLGGARNTGIVHATGAYILFLDADDWINPGMLSKTVHHVLNTQVDVLEFGAEGITPDGTITYRNAISSNGTNYSGVVYALRFHYMWSACNKLYRTAFLKENELYFMEQIYFEDLEFFTRMIPKVQQMQAVDDIVASFYQSGDSITRHNSDAKKQKAYRDIVTIIERLHGQLVKVDRQQTGQRQFYLQYLGILVVTLFYQFVKNRERAALADTYRTELRQGGMYYVDHRIVPAQKDVFRRIFLKNFWLLRILLALKTPGSAVE